MLHLNFIYKTGELNALLVGIKIVFLNISDVIFMFALCINSIKTLFIVPTDAHYYTNHRIFKTI